MTEHTKKTAPPTETLTPHFSAKIPQKIGGRFESFLPKCSVLCRRSGPTGHFLTFPHDGTRPTHMKVDHVRLGAIQTGFHSHIPSRVSLWNKIGLIICILTLH